ncbi:hypothetical protein [Paraburkholderia fungorum]|uniref:hypothetical protein n=1 Tax=Paraburkholderia fungorum TaxID=134537 RepID=UPI00130D8E11|nr:hypothetical protein [Paraburkholderia fungorum]
MATTVGAPHQMIWCSAKIAGQNAIQFSDLAPKTKNRLVRAHLASGERHNNTGNTA